MVDVEAEEVTEASVGKAPSLPSSFPALDGIGPNDAVGMGPWRNKTTRKQENKNNTPPQQHRNRQENNIKEENQGVSVFLLLKN